MRWKPEAAERNCHENRRSEELQGEEDKGARSKVRDGLNSDEAGLPGKA